MLNNRLIVLFILTDKMNQKKTDYFKYLKSKNWNNKRTEAYRLYGYKCQRCNVNKNLHVHHKTYARFKNENIKTDLAILCDHCHNLYHSLYSHTGIRTTNEFIKDKTTPITIKIKIKKLKAPVNKKLLFHPQKVFKVRGKSVVFAKTKIHNPSLSRPVELLN